MSCRQAGAQVPQGLSAHDCASIASIREAHGTERYAAHSIEGGHRARNPGQHWTTFFDGSGFLTQPDRGGWTWGLELEGYGFAGRERELTEPQQVCTEGARVTYLWDESLEEWYVNHERGLEHGFTVHQRPVRNGEGEDGRLLLTLAVRGTLRPQVTGGGRDVDFLGDQGTVELTYSGLRAFDADGRELNTGFEEIGDRLCLWVDERDARYPLTIDPTAQQAYLKASNTASDDLFGISVSVSVDTVVVAANQEDSAAWGVNGNQNDDSACEAGAAYVFVRSGTSWSQQAYLKASNTEAFDYFGNSAAVSGDTGLHQQNCNTPARKRSGDRASANPVSCRPA
jgi:hypothetical protein